MDVWLALGNASPLVIILTFVGLFVRGTFVLDREIKAIQVEREKSDARADRFEGMTLRLLNSTRKLAESTEKLAERDMP